MSSTKQTQAKRRKLGRSSWSSASKPSTPRAGINHLQYELLAEIFETVLFNATGFCERDQKTLSELTLVCRHWRDVCLNTPRLWSNLAFDFLGQESEDQVIIRRCKLWFSRAGGLPLSISIFIEGWRYNEDYEGYPSLPNPTDLWDYLASLTQLRCLRIRGYEIRSICEWFTHPWCSLASLIVDVSKECASGAVESGPYRDYDNVGIGSANGMLALRKCSAVGQEMGLKNLTSLTLHAYVSSFFVLSLLEESPLLHTLNISLHPKGYRSTPDADEDDYVTWKKLRREKRISLPRVSDLTLANITQQEELLEYVRIPHCRRLQVDDPRSHILPLLAECLQGSHVTLRQVNLRKLDVDDRRLLDFLTDYPRILSLTLHRLEHVEGTFLDYLMMDEYRPLPKLRSLDMAGNWKLFDTDTVVRFIKTKGRTYRGKISAGSDGLVDGDRTLEWGFFQDWLYPELFVRYDASDVSVKLLRTVKVDIGEDM